MLAWRLISVLSLELSLTSLLTELLGQSILENDLSSICSCGSKNRDRGEEKVNKSLLIIRTTFWQGNFFSHILLKSVQYYSIISSSVHRTQTTGKSRIQLTLLEVEETPNTLKLPTKPHPSPSHRPRPFIGAKAFTRSSQPMNNESAVIN